MKKTLKSILSLILALTCVLGLGAITVAAEDADPSVEIISKNVLYGETYHLMFAVEAKNLPEGASVELDVTDVDGIVLDVYKETMTVKGVECTVFTLVKGVAAQDIDEIVHAAASIKNADGQTVVETKPVSYSILEYLNERLYVSENSTDEQKELYTKHIEFGIAAEKVLDDGITTIADSVYVYNYNGTVDGVNRGGIYFANEQLDSFSSDVVAGENEKIVFSIYATDVEGKRPDPTVLDASDNAVYTIPEGTKRVEIYAAAEEIPAITSIAEATKAASGAQVVLTGKITKIREAWSSYKNMTVTISDGTSSIEVFRMKTQAYMGDTITVTGTIGVYNNTNQVAQGATAVIVTPHDCAEYTNEATCEADAICSSCQKIMGEALGHTEPNGENKCDRCGHNFGITTADLSLSFADKANRTSQTTTAQVWAQNGVTLTNNKAASTTAVADYAKPARFYANSELVIDCAGMTKIVFDCNSTSYATALKNSIGTVAGATVAVSSDKVTVTFDNAVDTFKIAKLSAQVRMDSLVVTAIAQ